jgi:predicted metal-dependent hydrolase
VEWGGVTIGYGWCHSRRRTLGMTIRPDKSVSVRVPMRTPVRDVRAFVTQRAEWILKIWKKMDAQPARPEQGYCEGSIILFQGRGLRLVFETGTPCSLRLRDGVLLLNSPDPPSEESVRRMIEGWYGQQMLEIVRERSTACHRSMQEEGIPLPSISIRFMKTRWGSYSYRTGRITLNLSLIKAPPACLDYVIIHELCHIKVRHHGADFWRMVARYRPDYLSERRQLRQYI